MLDKAQQLLKNVCTVDLRSLALMRIIIAISLGIDLFIRMVNIIPHYSDEGVLPMEALFRYSWNPFHFSVYTTGTIWQWQAVIFLLNFVCIYCLLVGYRTKLFTFLCWIFLLSLHNRNPLIHQGGDDLLRLILFWALFLPWGYYYSSDAAAIEKEVPKPTTYTSIAVLGYILQIMYVYLFSAFLKNSPEWNSEFTALYYALSFDQIVLPFGKWLYPNFQLLKLMTGVVYCVELLVPFLLLIPVYTRFFRIVFFIIMSLLHFGISLSLNVGIFPLIAVAGMVGILPPWMIDKLKASPAIQNFCSSFEFLKMHKKKNEFINPKETFVVTNLAIFFIFYTLSWNLSSIGKKPFLSTGKLEWIGHFLRVDQHWGMFAPSVFKDDGYFIFEAETEQKKVLDIMTGKQVSYARPNELQEIFRSDRWRKYAENFLFIVNGHYRPYFCFYLINHWNDQHDTNKVRALKIFYVKEVSLADYKTARPKQDQLCTCELHPSANK